MGYQGEMRVGLINRRLPNPPKGERPPMVAFYSALSGDTDVGADRPGLRLDGSLVADVATRCNVTPQQYYVFAPGAEYGAAKRWPAAHFAALARQLALPVLLLGSGKEAALCAEITQTANAARESNCVNFAGKTSLDEALALIAGARAMVSNDSGLMHVAAAMGVPQVALFGSSSPLHTPPLSDAAKVIWLKDDKSYAPALDCAPCFKRECPLGHTRCLNDIAPSEVVRFLR
jgi:heptosyltransferase-2